MLDILFYRGFGLSCHIIFFAGMIIFVIKTSKVKKDIRDKD
jgi:hypothetical protein